ncbi:MAG: hypothetical protein OEY59_01675 [Deltaproteobacteria bacterium]|nr:hypothetical protein [Deltaproteobacteria bacterium]
MEFNQIFCILKRSEQEYYHSTQQRSNRFSKLSPIKQQKINVSHENQVKFVADLKKLTQELGLKVNYIAATDMDRVSPGKNDLIISCGGDGTFLSCAQHYQNTFILGMNSDFSHTVGVGSAGALTSTNWTNLRQNLQSLLEKNYFIDQWSRLQVKINGELIPRLAVNDIYFGQKIAYQTCNFHITQSGVQEDFECSGVLCCTGMGSHAWYYNAGGSPFSNEIDAFGFKVLFPNLKRNLQFTSGIVSNRNELIIFSEGDDYILSFDSREDVLTMELGDEVRIFLAPDKDVRVVSFYPA